MSRDIWPNLILFAPVLLAVVVLSIIALRGRTRRSQPTCRTCGQALGDASPDEQRVCDQHAPLLQRTTFREGIFRCNVKPGDYQVHIKVDTVLVREKHLLGFDLASMSDDDWPPALDQ